MVSAANYTSCQQILISISPWHSADRIDHCKAFPKLSRLGFDWLPFQRGQNEVRTRSERGPKSNFGRLTPKVPWYSVSGSHTLSHVFPNSKTQELSAVEQRREIKRGKLGRPSSSGRQEQEREEETGRGRKQKQELQPKLSKGENTKLEWLYKGENHQARDSRSRWHMFDFRHVSPKLQRNAA